MEHFSELEHPEAMYFRGYWFLNPIGEYSENKKEAEKWMLRAKKAGSKLALARCLQEGWGCTMDRREAAAVLHAMERDAGDHPHPRVLGGLAFVYSAGYGALKDNNRSTAYLKRAVLLNDPTSMHNLSDTADSPSLLRAMAFNYAGAFFRRGVYLLYEDPAAAKQLILCAARRNYQPAVDYSLRAGLDALLGDRDDADDAESDNGDDEEAAHGGMQWSDEDEDGQ